MSRRRPLSFEEIQKSRLRQVSTGRGQANARPVRRFPTKTTRAPDPFVQRWVKLSRPTSQTFGNEVAITWTVESNHGSPIDFRGPTAVPTNVPDVSVTQPYAVHVIVTVSTVPTDLRAELRGNFPAVGGEFVKVGSAAWVAQFNASVVPDVTALSSLSVVGRGVGADVTCLSAEMWIYPTI